MKRFIFFLIPLVSWAPLDAFSVHELFSKIIITSDQATCSKDHKNSGCFVFQYKKNVMVTFADKSTVSADFLEVVFDSKMKKNTTHASKKKQHHNTAELNNFKQITFKNNVRIKNAQRSAQADQALLHLQDQRCVLEGNVKIVQTKEKEDDVPVEIKSQKAELNMTTGEVNFLGTSLDPVHTTVLLEGHPALRYSKKEKKHKKK